MTLISRTQQQIGSNISIQVFFIAGENRCTAVPNAHAVKELPARSSTMAENGPPGLSCDWSADQNAGQGPSGLQYKWTRVPRIGRAP